MNATEIIDKEIPNLVRKLKSFLGTNEVDRALSKHEYTLRTVRPAFSEDYLKNRHPWWNAFLDYEQLEKSGRSIRKNLTDSIANLAEDAKRVTTLQKIMPRKVREKYQRDLLDIKNARNYLFEIKTAWHFYSRGCTIIWYEEKNKPEYRVDVGDFSFDVECKSFSFDSTRKIHRKDFCHFADYCLPQISEMRLRGRIDLVIRDRLPSNTDVQQGMVDGILCELRQGSRKGAIEGPFGEMTIDLEDANGNRVNLNALEEKMWKRKPHEAHSAIFAPSYKGSPVDPIEMTVKSDRADQVLVGIRKRISKAISYQLDPSRPGYIACFIPEIPDFLGLESESGLSDMTYDLFEDIKTNHVLAISFSSDSQMEVTEYGRESNMPAVIFKNPQSMFELPDHFQLLKWNS